MRVRPSPAFIAAAALLSAAGLLVFTEILPAGILLIGAGGLLGAALADLALTVRLKAPGLTPPPALLLALGRPHRVTLAVDNPGAGKTLTIRLPLPRGFDREMTQLSLKGNRQPGRLTFSFRIKPLVRGRLTAPPLVLELSSPLLLWQRRFEVKYADEWQVYPDFTALMSQHFSWDNARAEEGIKTFRRRGAGSDFYGLREYQRGDSLRFIDWRATSRRGKPMVKEFQEEQDQQVIILLDTGYRLHQPQGELTHFDSALYAALLLAQGAFLHGDRLGVLTFGTETRWIPPLKGRSRMAYLLSQLYDLQSSSQPSSPAAALEEVLKRVKRRSLVVLLTNLREEDEETLDEMIRLIPRRHLLLTLNLREEQARYWAEKKPETFEEALTVKAARNYEEERHRIQRLWKKRGIITLETTAEALPRELSGKYLELKRSGQF